VEDGEDLALIAIKHSTTVDAIVELSNIPVPDIQPGETLQIPKGNTRSSPSIASVVYVQIDPLLLCHPGRPCATS
jgi:LysM repeat protein